MILLLSKKSLAEIQLVFPYGHGNHYGATSCALNSYVELNFTQGKTGLIMRQTKGNSPSQTKIEITKLTVPSSRSISTKVKRGFLLVSRDSNGIPAGGSLQQYKSLKKPATLGFCRPNKNKAGMKRTKTELDERQRKKTKHRVAICTMARWYQLLSLIPA